MKIQKELLQAFRGRPGLGSGFQVASLIAELHFCVDLLFMLFSTYLEYCHMCHTEHGNNFTVSIFVICIMQVPSRKLDT